MTRGFVFAAMALCWAALPGNALAGQVWQCIAEMLDVRVWPPVEPKPSIGLHELVIEFRNRSDSHCQLRDTVVQLLPREGADGFTGGDSVNEVTDPQEKEFREHEYTMGAGETAHISIAWRSRGDALHPLCVNRDGVGVSLRYDLPPFLDIEHVWMRVCDRAYVSRIRLGRYLGDAPTEEWLTRLEAKPKDFLAPQSVEPRAPDAQAISIGPVADRVMLGDFFELFLDFAKPQWTCPYILARKREADGQTRVYINHCEDGGEDREQHRQEKSSTWLEPIQIGMKPERAGRVEYEVISRAKEGEKFVYATATTSVMVKDPKPPGLPAIDTTLAECEAAQLKATNLPKLEGGKFHDAFVYDVTNVSGTSCRVGGVPQLDFWFPIGPSHSTTPSACPNCEDPLFKPRPSGWIDLGPGASAHFLVGATRYDTEDRHWRQICDVVDHLVLTLSEGQTLTLPFGAGTCKGVTVSAWREGKYDGDAMNVAFAKSVPKRKDAALPAQCARADFSTLGRPMMLEPFSSGLQFGLSVAGEKIELGKPAVLHLWIDNPSDKAVAVSTCMDLDYFWATGFDLYDASGHRVLRKKIWEPERKPAAGEEEIKNKLCSGGWACFRNFAIRIPAHTCFNGEADPKGYDFNRDLAMYYDLPPGTYCVVPRTGKMDANRCQEVAPKLELEALREKLRFTIREN